MKQFTSLHLLSALGCLLPVLQCYQVLKILPPCPLLGLIFYCISFGSRDCMNIYVCLYIYYEPCLLNYIKLPCFLFLSLPWPLQFQCESSTSELESTFISSLTPSCRSILAASFCRAVQQTTPSWGSLCLQRSGWIASISFNHSAPSTPLPSPKGDVDICQGKTNGKQENSRNIRKTELW